MAKKKLKDMPTYINRGGKRSISLEKENNPHFLFNLG